MDCNAPQYPRMWLIFLLTFASLPQVSIPAWFTVDTRLGSLSVHLDTPQCFSAEMYSADLNIVGKPEDDKVQTYSFLCSLVTCTINQIWILK